VQVEVGYLTNRDEEALLSDEAFLRDVARAIADGVAAYRAASDDGRR
jgi:N-acetylmuramoyl-L-alanine amidase